jgi:hypothetical protein
MDHGTNHPLIFRSVPIINAFHQPHRVQRLASTASCPTLFINRIVPNAWHQPHRAQRLASTASCPTLGINRIVPIINASHPLFYNGDTSQEDRSLVQRQPWSIRKGP